MHGVASLVHQREQIPQSVLFVIEQDIWPACVATGRERTGALALVLVLVHPAAGQPLLKHGAVFLAKRRHCLYNLIHGFVIAMLYFHS